jgi:hypothetical protein
MLVFNFLLQKLKKENCLRLRLQHKDKNDFELKLIY